MLASWIVNFRLSSCEGSRSELLGLFPFTLPLGETSMGKQRGPGLLDVVSN